jgi:DNA mismatch repair protein MutS
MLDPASPTSPPPGDARVTPMMAQYIEIKAANPDSLLFYRMGDFYELFFDDAEIASRTLGIVLTRRGKHAGQDIPMCGVPVERADDYLQRLIAAGHRVAVCEQTEDPAEAKKRGAKSVVRRDVVRLVTPGTITEEALLEPARANILLAVSRRRVSDDASCYGLAALDISTGRFLVSETDEAGLATEIARIEPREIILADAVHEDPRLENLWRDTRASVTPIAREGLDPGLRRAADPRLFRGRDPRRVRHLRPRRDRRRGPGPPLHRAHAARRQAAPAAARPRGHLRRARHRRRDRANLELTRTLSGERAGSLLAVIDRTVTPAGGRLLAERLAGPLTDPARSRPARTRWPCWWRRGTCGTVLRRGLKSAPDLARALTRLALGGGGPGIRGVARFVRRFVVGLAPVWGRCPRNLRGAGAWPPRRDAPAGGPSAARPLAETCALEYATGDSCVRVRSGLDGIAECPRRDSRNE